MAVLQAFGVPDAVWVQTGISFLAGGLLITVLTLLAERAPARIAGLIVTFPSTIVLGLFFLGRLSGAETVAAMVPGLFIPLGLVAFAPVLYCYAAILMEKAGRRRLPGVAGTLLLSVAAWLLLVLPVVRFKVRGVVPGLLVYGTLVLLAIFLLRARRTAALHQIRPRFTFGELAFRAVSTGSVIGLSVFLGKTLNPTAAGIVTMFPVATFSTLAILHRTFPPGSLFVLMRRAPVGSLSLLLYAVSVQALFPRFGVWWGTLFCCLIAGAFSLLLMAFSIWKHPAKQL